MEALDPRLLKVTIIIGDQELSYQDLAIRVNGTKYANGLNNEAEVTIYNLQRSEQDFILTQTSPYRLGTQINRVRVEAGRESYGLTLIYTGFIVLSNLSQPPDIGVTLQCMSWPFNNQNSVVVNGNGQADLATVIKQVAEATNLQINNQSSVKKINNFAKSGSPHDIVFGLNALGNINAFIDNDVLVVKDGFVPLKNTFRLVSAENGMIGIPEFIETGVRVKFFIDNKTTLGGELGIKSDLYPATNGNYVIYKLAFELANRDTPFYYIAECQYRRT